jgi:hypothetical protein
MKIFYLLIFALTLNLASCKKSLSYHRENLDPECAQPGNTCVYATEAKEYFYFKTGSYWVYQDSVSGQRDSMYVTTSSNNTAGVYFKTRMFSARDSFQTSYFPTVAISTNGCSQKLPIKKS